MFSKVQPSRQLYSTWYIAQVLKIAGVSLLYQVELRGTIPSNTNACDVGAALDENLKKSPTMTRANEG